MKKICTPLLYILCLCLIHISVSAQSGSERIEKRAQLKFYQVQDAGINHHNFFRKNASDLSLSADSKMSLHSVMNGHGGFTHYRFKQSHRDLPVVGGTYILHEKNGQVQSANGYLLPDIDISTIPTISSDYAWAVARDDIKGEVFAEDKKGPVAYTPPAPRLAIMDKNFPRVSDHYRLVYIVEQYSLRPLAKNEYYIDAHTGQILQTLPLIHASAVEGVGKTKYYGEQKIITDSIAPGRYHLHDPTRGDGITTMRDGDDPDLFDDDNYWDLTATKNGEVAIDAHYCTERFYDLMMEHFQWSGLDGEGLSMNPIVNLNGGVPYVNAYWNGRNAYFGDGDCHYGPLTTLDVVGHEFMHGITDYTSDLIYADESGAMNESMSDIFGKANEFYNDPDNFDWELGSQFAITPYAENFRSMEDPPKYNDPDLYKGSLWTDGAGVHTNSGVLNHWFYLMVEGKKGTNEFGDDYDVVGIGMDKALQIPFLLQTSYLTESSTYPEAFEASLLAADELYGDGSPEKMTMVEAWKAVGLPAEVSESLPDVSIEIDNPSRSQCLDNEFLDFSFVLTNNGTDTIEAGTTFLVELTIDADTSRMLSFENDLLPGADTTFVIDDLLKVNMDDYYFVRVTIDFEDSNSGNNRDIMFFYNSTNPEPDIELVDIIAAGPDCGAETGQLIVSIQNNSCNFLSNGTAFEIQLFNDNNEMIHSEQMTTDGGMPSGFTDEIAVDFDLTDDYTSLEAVLVYQADSDLNNNMQSVDLRPTSVVRAEYLNTFTEDPDLQAGVQILNDRGVLGIARYGSDFYFATTGLEFSNSDAICPGSVDNFETNEYYGRLPELQVCIDLEEDLLNPVLSFDLVHFYNDLPNDYPELAPYYSMTRVLWEEDGEQKSMIITEQEEGMTVKHEIELPMGYQGDMRFQFFNNTGRASIWTDNGDFNQYDYTLFDNLAIKGGTVSNKNPEAVALEILPNPARHQVRLGLNLQQNGALNLYDVTGRLIRTESYRGGSNSHEMDISDLSGGIYLIKLLSDDRQQLFTGKFVKE